MIYSIIKKIDNLILLEEEVSINPGIFNSAAFKEFKSNSILKAYSFNLKKQKRNEITYKINGIEFVIQKNIDFEKEENTEDYLFLKKKDNYIYTLQKGETKEGGVQIDKIIVPLNKKNNSEFISYLFGKEVFNFDCNQEIKYVYSFDLSNSNRLSDFKINTHCSNCFMYVELIKETEEKYKAKVSLAANYAEIIRPDDFASINPYLPLIKENGEKIIKDIIKELN